MNTLREAINDYIDMRRGLGFKLDDVRRSLLDFAKYMEQQQAPFITVKLALAWAQQPVNVQPSRWARRLSQVRGFARHRKATDPRTEIPADGLLPFEVQRAKPYLYTDEEIRNLLQAALDMTFTYERSSLQPWLFHCLFGLLAVTGMRVGEACNLELRDFDPESAVLTIRGAKYGRERLVPLHRSTCDVVADYITRREHHWQGRAISPYLFVTNKGNRLSESGKTDNNGPRLHDLRHSFAMNTLVSGYRQDRIPERLVPILSTWLGHTNVADTQWYLEARPELMREAVRRLESRWEDQS